MSKTKKRIYRLIDRTRTPDARLLAEKAVHGHSQVAAVIALIDSRIFFDLVELPEHTSAAAYLKDTYKGFDKVVVLTGLHGCTSTEQLYDRAGIHLYNYLSKRGINVKLI
jgi:hypothetical protein